MIINDNLNVFRTFMPFHRIRRKTSNFSSPLYALAYLLKDIQNIDLKAHKYSNQEIQLIKELVHSAKIDIRNDTQFITILSSIFQKDILHFLSQYHKKDLTKRFTSLCRYMCTLNELQIDGKTLDQMGHHDRQIGKVKHILLDQVHQRKTENTPEALSQFVKENPSLFD